MATINKQVVIWSLEELASREDQERLWLSDGTTGEVSSFVEAICGVFDDGGVSRAIDSEALPKELLENFRELARAVKEIPLDITPQDQIDHPSMMVVSRLASELLKIVPDQVY